MHKSYQIIGLFIITFIFLSFFSQTRSSAFITKTVLGKTDTLTNFIPHGYSILDTLSGNLNGDDIPDMIMILKKDGEDTMYNPVPKRPLYILRGISNMEYALHAKNDNVVYTHDMGGLSKFDPFDGIKIEDNIFCIEHSGGMTSYRWDSQIYFQFAANEDKCYLLKKQKHELSLSWVLDSIETDKTRWEVSFDSTRIETSKDFGRIRFEDFDFNKDDH